MDSGGNSIRLTPIMHPPEALALTGTMRQCPFCRELLPGEDWRRLPRHETHGMSGKTTQITCPKCCQPSLSTQWQELRRRQAVVL